MTHVYLILIPALIAGCLSQPEPTTTTTTNPPPTRCVLSLCDCECYPDGETPEQKRGVLCGVDCRGIYNITGCRLEDGECVKVKKQ